MSWALLTQTFHFAFDIGRTLIVRAITQDTEETLPRNGDEVSFDETVD